MIHNFNICKMKKIVLFIFTSTLLIGIAYSQELSFSASDYDDPAIFEKGQNAPHAFHIPYSSLSAATSNNAGANGHYKLLNGEWDFKLVERPDLVPADFHNPAYKTKGWDKITVPSNWQMEGFGHPKFRNVALSFESNPPHIPFYYNPTGCYKRKFTVAEDWMSKEVILRFEGIKSASYIWVNGEKIGYNQGGFEPAEFSISKYLKKGENDISIEVIRFCDGSYLENQDMWRLSGIYRDVKLVALPKTHIQDFFYYTDFDANYTDATLFTEVNIANLTSSNLSDYSLEVDVTNAEGTILSEKLMAKADIQSKGSTTIKLNSLVKKPKQWSAEYPNLYTISFVLKDNTGKTVEAFTKKIGFKEVELKGEVITVNGVGVKLNGVNSHMHHPKHGQAVPLETLRKDLLIMKQYNINCVRTSHYPPTPEYLEMADELGMYIVDEVSDEAHFNIHLSDDSTYTEMYRDRSHKLVYRDRNHVSIIMWSAGNESGSGFNIHEVIKTGAAIDSTRPGWMYGGNTFYIPFEHVTGPRYWEPYQVKNLAERKTLGPNDLRPSFMDEYLAATGNGLGGLDEYWTLIWKYPRLSGGAIWDWISPGIDTPHWILPDASAEKNDGAIMGRPKFVAHGKGRALALSGHDDWVEFYRHSSLDITGNELTIDFWVSPTEITQPNTFITKGKHGYGIIMNTPKTLEFYTQIRKMSHTEYNPYLQYTPERISAIANVPANWYGSWHHVTGIYNGKQLTLYIDGKEVAATAETGTIMDTAFPLCIGRDAETQDQGEHAGRMSAMMIDDVRVFNKAISPNKIETETEGKVLDLDFETDSRGKDFYAIGLGGRTYGIVWPDRTIQPEIYQVKKAGQPINVEVLSLENQRFKIVNRHHFKNLSDFDIDWMMMVDGKETETGKLSINLAAQDTTELKIPYTLGTSGESILTISFKLKEHTKWAEAGYEVAFNQFEIENIVTKTTQPSNGKIEVADNKNELIISGSDFKYAFDKATGLFNTLSYNNTEYVQQAPLFNVWRAPISNDIDPWGAHAYAYVKDIVPGLGRSIDNQLRSSGLRDLVYQADEITAIVLNNGSAKVTIHKWCNASNDRAAFECKEIYTINANGEIAVDLTVIPHDVTPDMLPRIGWQFELPKTFSNVEWYGRGAIETYPDRKTGAKIGIYKSNADTEYVPYIIPQDYGNHTDVRWINVSNSTHHGLLIKGQKLLNFSFQKYSTDNLSRAMYTYQLKDTDFNTLNVDFEVSGVGGTAIRQLKQYRVSPMGIKNYQFIIQPY